MTDHHLRRVIICVVSPQQSYNLFGVDHIIIKLSFIRSFVRSLARSVGQSVSRSAGQPASRPAGQPASRPARSSDCLTSQSVSRCSFGTIHCSRSSPSSCNVSLQLFLFIHSSVVADIRSRGVTYRCNINCGVTRCGRLSHLPCNMLFQIIAFTK